MTLFIEKFIWDSNQRKVNEFVFIFITVIFKWYYIHFFSDTILLVPECCYEWLDWHSTRDLFNVRIHLGMRYRVVCNELTTVRSFLRAITVLSETLFSVKFSMSFFAVVFRYFYAISFVFWKRFIRQICLGIISGRLKYTTQNS